MDAMLEKIGALSAKADAAHTRVDKLELMLREDLKEIKMDLKDLTAHMNKTLGWYAALMFLAGGAGAGMVKLVSMLK